VDEAVKGKEDFVLGFIDEASPQNCNSVRLWGFRKPRIRKNTSKIRANTMGFYTFNGQSVVDFTEDSKQETFANFLFEIRKNNVCDHVIIILDNFSTHKSALVKATARMLGITLVYLPPYSPELNPIEEIWKSIRRVLSTKFYLTKQELQTIIQEAYYDLIQLFDYAKQWITNNIPNQFKTLPQ
jgi:putative transposase